MAGNDNAVDPDCIISTVPTILQGNIFDHVGFNQSMLNLSLSVTSLGLMRGFISVQFFVHDDYFSGQKYLVKFCRVLYAVVVYRCINWRQ